MEDKSCSVNDASPNVFGDVIEKLMDVIIINTGVLLGFIEYNKKGMVVSSTPFPFFWYAHIYALLASVNNRFCNAVVVDHAAFVVTYVLERYEDGGDIPTIITPERV